jgi:hypothetical protein
MISFELEEKPDSKWNDRLLESQFGTIFQTREYAAYVEDRLKSKPTYVKFQTEKGEIIAQLVVFRSFKGRTKLAGLLGKGSVYSAISKASKLLPKNTNWLFGPVLLNTSYQSEVAESLGNLLKSWKGNFQGSPHPLCNEFTFPTQFNFKRKELGTFLIDLKQDLNQILDNVDKKSVKKNIERSQNRGVVITQINSQKDLEIYHEILNQHRKDSNIPPYSFEDVKHGYEILTPMGQIGFLAWKDKIPIGGIFASTFNGYINESGIARTAMDLEEKLYSQDLLRWKIIEWGKENNCNYYDLSGVQVSNRTAKEDGIFRNKEKWGGKLVTYPSFST